LFTERETNPLIVGLMKAFPTAIPAVTESSIVAFCASVITETIFSNVLLTCYGQICDSLRRAVVRT
jgi:hypothetical protein